MHALQESHTEEQCQIPRALWFLPHSEVIYGKNTFLRCYSKRESGFTNFYPLIFSYLSAVSLKAYIRMSIHDSLSLRTSSIPTITAFTSANFSPVPQTHALRLPSDVESFLGLSSPAVWCCCWLYESSTVFPVPNYVRPCVSLTFCSWQYRKVARRI